MGLPVPKGSCFVDVDGDVVVGGEGVVVDDESLLV